MNRNELSSVQLQILAAIAKRVNNTKPDESKEQKEKENVIQESNQS
jgi:hypothetical protein